MAVMTNDSIISFPSPTGTWSVPTHFAVLFSQTTAISSSAFVITGTLPSGLAAPASGDTVQFAASQLSITITGDELTERAWKIMLDTWAGASRYVSLHTASPTASNELSGSSYARAQVTRDDWTIT